MGRLMGGGGRWLAGSGGKVLCLETFCLSYDFWIGAGRGGSGLFGFCAFSGLAMAMGLISVAI